MSELLALPELLPDGMAEEGDDLLDPSNKHQALELHHRERSTNKVGDSSRKFEGAELVTI